MTFYIELVRDDDTTQPDPSHDDYATLRDACRAAFSHAEALSLQQPPPDPLVRRVRVRTEAREELSIEVLYRRAPS